MPTSLSPPQATPPATPPATASGTGSPLRTDTGDPQTLKEAAQEFETVLVRQFVEVMTKDMFSASLTGDDGPGWMDSQRGTQRDMMTDQLTRHLAESDAFSFEEQLLQKWSPARAPSSPEQTPALQTPVDPRPHPLDPPRPSTPSIDHAA